MRPFLPKLTQDHKLRSGMKAKLVLNHTSDFCGFDEKLDCMYWCLLMRIV
jgi:hypothetical protein